MKTGGTLNFLKRAGAIFMLLAIFASSCNKYADDFDQINTKLDALAVSVAGVAQLTTDMSALKTQVAALQTAVASLPTKAQMDAQFATMTTTLAAITTKIDGITATLATVATTGTATKAVVDKLATDLAALAIKVAADDAAMTLQLTGLAADNVTMKANLQTLIANNTALAAQITAVQNQITALVGAGGTDMTALTIQGLQLMLKAQQATLDKLLANSNMYNGSVNITSDAEVAFWLPKIGVWKDGGMVNGTLNINTTSITNLTDLKTITDNILAVIGGLTSDFTLTTKSGNALTFAKLASTTGSITVTTAAAAGEVSFPVLTSVAEDYTVTGYDINDAALTTVGGTVTLTYDGGYSQPALVSAANVVLADYKTNATSGNVAHGTLAVDFAGLSTVTTSFQTAAAVSGAKGQTANLAAAANTVAFQSATSVIIGSGAKVVAVTAPAALDVQLHFAGSSTNTLSGLAITAGNATSVTAKVVKVAGNVNIVAKTTGSTVSLPGLTAVTGTTDITGVTLSAPVAATLTGAVTLNNTTPVSLPALTSAPGGITAAAATAFSAPVLVSSGVTVAAAKTVELASTATASLTTVVLETLKIDALEATLAVPSTVITATITGKDGGTYASTASVVTAGGNNLVSLTLNGVIKSASVSTSTSLTSLTTSGVVNSLTVNACTNAALTSLALGHTHYVGGPGSTLIITGNTKLTSLTTSTDKASVLTVTGNTALASMNFASYATILNTGSTVGITISSNALTGTFTPAVAMTPTTAYSEAIIKQASLATIKTYLTAVLLPANGLTATISLDVDDVDPTAGVLLLSTAMAANDAVSTAIDESVGNTTINKSTEVALIIP